MKCTLHVKIAVHTAQIVSKSTRITDAQDVMQNMYELLEDLEKDLVGRRMEKYRWCPTTAGEFSELVQSNCKLLAGADTRLGLGIATEILDAENWLRPRNEKGWIQD